MPLQHLSCTPSPEKPHYYVLLIGSAVFGLAAVDAMIPVVALLVTAFATLRVK